MPRPSTQNPTRRISPSALTGVCTIAALIVCGSVGSILLSQQAPNQSASLSTISWIVAEPETTDPGASGEPDKNEGIRECVITLQSGRTITGELIREDSREVVIGINGIETTFLRKNVSNVVILPPVPERYKQLRASVDDGDIDARLALVEWLRARRAYSLAITELESILLLEPKNPRARLLHTWLKEYDKLAEQREDDGDEESQNPDQDNEELQGTPEKPEEPQYQIRRNARPLLTPEQINLMKVYEIDLRDPPKMRISDDTMLKLMREFPDRFSPNENERARVLDLPNVEKLKLIFSLRARDLYNEIEVLENPQSLDRFKDAVHAGRGWLMNACATTRCHGGVDAGSFRLVNEKPNTDETAFTNLYIIENTKLANGMPLIDFENPDRSPLLQMGMIQSTALIPHPEIPRDYPGTGYRPVFRSTRDRKYQQAVDWIRSMYQPRPELEFDYPLNPAKTQPEPDQNQP
ncbi:MAG: hypothetical protein JJ916_06600 [Phycisphaerales bacterium]|nr:hypothetical protein [Phycisphaerales bacterium]